VYQGKQQTREIVQRLDEDILLVDAWLNSLRERGWVIREATADGRWQLTDIGRIELAEKNVLGV
jgi:DNA-binding MarR family transcriptional regulator